MLVRCDRCRDVHEAVIPPMLAMQFLASCPMCRDASYEEIVTYRQDATEKWI